MGGCAAEMVAVEYWWFREERLRSFHTSSIGDGDGEIQERGYFWGVTQANRVSIISIYLWRDDADYF